MSLRRPLLHIGLMLIILLLVACDSAHNAGLQQAAQQPQAEDRCPICGMKILGWPGPKGQLYKGNSNTPLFFDSSLELLAYALQPEYQHEIHHIYVQDMTLANWDQPDEAPWIDARHAWFVLGHTRMGSMGPTLASFADQQAALQFVEHYQGEVLPYAEVTLEHLLQLAGHAAGVIPPNSGDHRHERGHHHH